MFKVLSSAAVLAVASAGPAPDAVCFDAKDVKGEMEDCYQHVVWAKGEGEDSHPAWYPAGAQRDDIDLQCALYVNTFNNITGDGHNCRLPPCTPISETMRNQSGELVKRCITTAPMTKVATPEDKPLLEWWAWVLIGFAIVGLLAAVAYFLGFFKKPKKKRAVKITQETATVPKVPVEIAPPIYTYMAPPTEVITAPPVYTEVVQAPTEVVYAAAPVSTEVVYAAPPAAATEVIIAPPVYTEVMQPGPVVYEQVAVVE